MRITDHEELVTTMQNALHIIGNPLTSVLGALAQDDRSTCYPSDRDQAERDGAELRFAGDAEDKPPLSWVILHRGRYMNRFGYHTSDHPKLWGYVFWDVGRLTRIGGKEDIRQTETGRVGREFNRYMF
jgi:hypothetical protein